MYMCYLDESGTVENAGTSHFVLVGMAVPEEFWKVAETQIAECKIQFNLSDEEVHTAWIARRYLEQESIPDFESMTGDERRKESVKKRELHLLRLAAHGTAKQLKDAKKNYRKTFPYLHLTYTQRMDLLRQLADKLGSWSDVRIFAEVADKKHVLAATSTNPNFSLFEHAFTELVQRFEYFLRNRGHAVSRTLSGILIQDNNETVASKLTETMRRFHREGTKWTQIDHIIETPLFVDSHLTSMVQMADICGYAIRRHFENGEDDLFDRIYSRFDRTRGRLVGVRHNTSAGCICRICGDHA